MFTPAPKVDSAIVKIDFVEKYDIKDREVLQKLIKGAFQMRRKTLTNNLKNAFGISQEKSVELLSKLNLSSSVRGESLTTMQFVELSNELANLLKK